MGIENNIFAFKKATRYSLPFVQRETRSNDLLVFSKMADHSLIPRSSPLFKMAVESNFPPWGPLWMSKSPPTCALRSLIPVGCPAAPSWGKPLIGALFVGMIEASKLDYNVTFSDFLPACCH